MMTSIGMFGTAVCSGSATTLTLLFPAIRHSAACTHSETRTLNNPDVPSPYPAGAELFFRAVTAIHESTFALKVAFVVCDFAIVLVLLEILRRSRQGMHWVLAYAWHPLLATEVAGSGHIDIVGVLLLLVSFAALGRRWRAIAAVAFGLAIAVKLLPIVLLAALLEARSYTRRHPGEHRNRTPIRSIFETRMDSHRLARHLCAEFPL